ncbi:MAG: beta strand repeat-containing protein, partial [Planctomycetota bacterium]
KIVRINGDDNIILNNIIRGDVSYQTNGEYGILIYGDDNWIQGNEIHDIGYMGINIVGPPHSGASDNTIINNNVHDIGIYAIGIDRSPGNTITGNTISNVLGGNLALFEPSTYYYDPAVWCWGIIVWGETADGTQIIDQVVSGLPNGIVLSSAHNTLVQGCDIENNTGIGLKVAESSWAGGIPTGNQIIGNNINNNDTGVEISGTIGAGNVFNENSIAGNTSWGMNNTSNPTEVDATANWWGHASGPYDNSDDTGTGGLYNPTGLGDTVSDYVDYNPWWALGTDTAPGTPGFQPESPMTWGGLGIGGFDIQWWIDNVLSPGASLVLNFPGFAVIGPIDDHGNNITLTFNAGDGLQLDGKISLSGDFTVDAVGDLTVNGAIDPGYVDLQANDILVNALILAVDFITLWAGTDDTGNVTIDNTGGSTGSLQTTAAGSDITVIAGTALAGGSGNISLLGDATIETQGGTGDGHVITLTAYDGAIAMADTSLIDAGDGKIAMSATTAAGNITLGGLLTTGNAADAVTITAGGAVVDGGDTDVDIDAASGTAVINAATGIGAGDAIETTVATLEADTTTGDIEIDETDNITLAEVDTGNGSIDITSGGSIELDDEPGVVSALGGGDVTLTAAEAITVLNATTQTEIANTGSVILTAKAVGDTNPLDLDGATSLVINDLDGAGQDIDIREQTGASSIASTTITVATPTAGDIDIDYFGTDVVDIDEGHNLVDVDLSLGGSDFTYTATTGPVVTVYSVDTGTGDATITASTGSIKGVNDNGNADVAGATVTLVAGFGNIRGASAGEALDVTATTALNADTTGDDGYIVIDSIGNLPVGVLNAGNGDVTVDSTGTINDDGFDVLDIIADQLSLTAQGEIGGSDAIETQVDTLEAFADAAGNIDIAEADDILLADIETFDGDITVSSATGDIEVGAIEAGAGTDNVNLEATTGSILDDGFAGTSLFAGTADLDALGGDIGDTGSFGPLDTKVVTLDATASGSIYVTESLGDLSLNPVTAGADIDIENTDGDITIDGTVKAAGNIDIKTSGSDIIVNATIDLDGSGGGTLTLDSSDDIIINAAIEDTVGADDDVDVVFNALDNDPAPGDSQINVDISASIDTYGGSFTSTGTTFENTGGEISTDGGNITLNHTGLVKLGADLDEGAGAISGTATSIEVLSSLAEIQDGIDVAHLTNGATITVHAGTYDENLSVDKPDITLQSRDPDIVTLEPTSGDVLSITTGADNFTLGGAADQGFTVDTTTSSDTDAKGVSASDTEGLTISYNAFIADDDNISIEAEDVVDLLIFSNTFTASSAIGVDLSAVTGSSAVQSNVIDDYDIGIRVSPGATGTDGLSISGNDILNNTTGILFSSSGAGDTENVSVEYNRLVADDSTDTGIEVEAGTNVKADTFTIQYNGFQGDLDATGLKNDNALLVTAAKNWWGAADGPDTVGPGSGVHVSTNVDYSPWLGLDDAEPGIIGFQVASPMIWWTDDILQDAIDAASTSGDDVIVALAGLYDSEPADTVNVDKQLAGIHFIGAAPSTVDADLKLTNDDADWDGGALLMDTIATIAPDFTTTPSNEDLTLLRTVTDPDPGYHSLTLDTGTGTTHLEDSVTVGKDLTLMSGAASAGDMILTAGDSIHAHGTLTTIAPGAGGNIELTASESTIYLSGNVNADVADDGDIIVNSHVIIDPDVKLHAGQNVTLKSLTEALGNLTIEATTGEILAADIYIESPHVEARSTLELIQLLDLDMQDAMDDLMHNGIEPKLKATSTGGHVTETMAPRWDSIEAWAQTFIELDDTDAPGDITTDSLHAETEDVLVASHYGKVYAQGPIYAGRDVKIMALDEASPAIFLNHYLSDPDIEAVGDIWLVNNTLAADGVSLKAGQDVRVGWQGLLNPWDP